MIITAWRAPFRYLRNPVSRITVPCGVSSPSTIFWENIIGKGRSSSSHIGTIHKRVEVSHPILRHRSHTPSSVELVVDDEVVNQHFLEHPKGLYLRTDMQPIRSLAARTNARTSQAHTRTYVHHRCTMVGKNNVWSKLVYCINRKKKIIETALFPNLTELYYKTYVIMRDSIITVQSSILTVAFGNYLL